MSPEQPGTTALAELQRQFVCEVLYREAPELLSQVLANGRRPEARVAIYRRNAQETFALALEAAFPLLLACMGAEEFRQLAWAYQRACPSPAGNLFHAGARLPGFLAAHLKATADECLVDVAHLEWATQESLVAADCETSVDLAALGEVPASRQGDIRFELHPSVRLVDVRYGVFRPWEGLRAGAVVHRPVAGAEHILVRRLADGVQLQRVTAADSAWLEALRAGVGFADSAEVLPPAAQADLGSILMRWVSARVITSFSLAGLAQPETDR